MKFKICVTVLLLAICSAPASVAEDTRQPAPNGERSSHAIELAAGERTSADAATDNSEVFLNVLIPAGKTVTLDSGLDFTNATGVAVTVMCTTCTNAATSLSSAGLTLQARWMVADAEAFVAIEHKAAAAFAYWDAGGAIFSAYGSKFRLALQNKGSASISLPRVTMFRRN